MVQCRYCTEGGAYYGKQFTLDAVQYYHERRNLGMQGCVSNSGINQQTL